MDYYNHLQRDNFYKDDISRNNYNGAEDKKVEQFTIQQIELYIQQQYQVNVPGIVFEYNSQVGGKDFAGWDHDDLAEFFGHFGEIETLEISGKMCFVLFKSFFDANTAREFLQNSSNFKEAEKNNFTAKWFKSEDEKDFSDSFKTKIQQIIQKYNENNLKNFQQTINNNNMLNAQQQNNYSFYPQNWGNQMNMMNQQNNLMMGDQSMGYGGNPNMNSNNNNMNNLNSNKNKGGNNSNIGGNMQQYNGINGNMGGNSQNFNVTLANGRKNSSNSNADEDRKNQQQQQNGKFTCRFELQIENDKEFQVARRLIGAKGCNMKKIVDTCSKNSDGSMIKDAVKLRLRGKGSGYKEGPLNKESDEPLHLCISSKFLEKYKLACNQVQELVSSVYEEYKKYCEKTNKVPVSCLAIRKEEGISSRKSTVNNKQEFDA